MTDGLAELLCRLAREGKAFVGGSFLAWRDGNAYNSFILALPNGKTLRHDKDYPSYWEACYYVGGSDDGVLSTPDGNVGVALCYEFVRSRTAARLKGKVGMVVGGSCWWGIEDTAPADDPMRKWLLDLLKATPGRFARLLGVPVVHASHAGRFEGRSWPGEPAPFPSSYLGETQIVNGRGEILARMSREDGEDVKRQTWHWVRWLENALPFLTVSGFPRCPPKKIASGRHNSRADMNTTCPIRSRL